MKKEHIKLKQKAISSKIVGQASHVFSKYGFKKATMDDIAKASGMAKSSLYYYFKSKEEVFEAVVKKEANLIRSELEKRVINSQDNPKDKIRNYVLIRMKFLKEMVNFYETLKNDYLGNLAFTERIREKYDREEQQIIQILLQQGIDAGIFKLKETKISSITLSTALKGLETALLIKNTIPQSQMEKHLDETLQILFYGIVKQ
ncbi:MAG: TetR/AcrR family transcriptional regulator [Bacteroidales bacterium]|jgi:AcrR family transcriptional regulator|nr:TetR/AcrR family transcriptional regulator [Bacteroidales bacterium]